MALFGKKKEGDQCAICGKERKTGLFRGLFQASVDGQYVCGDCYGIVDLPAATENQMSIQEFKEYMNFRKENLKLKDRFAVSSSIDFGILDSKVVFDHTHGYLCLSKELDKTIFERKHLSSFAIREDSHTIFEGNANGMNSYGSNVHNQLRLMQPKFTQFRQEMRTFQDKLNRMSPEQQEKERSNKPRFNSPEPFQNFYVDLYFDHPYWKEITLDMAGPRFHSESASLEDYLTSYRLSFGTMEQLAQNLESFLSAKAGMASEMANSASSQADAAETLKRFKELLDMGVLTEEEFAAKKRQLLGL